MATKVSTNVSNVSVSITDSTYQHSGYRVEAWVTVDSVWRGQAAKAIVRCDRYETADGNLTDWRCYVSRAFRADVGEYGGEDLTETAKRRLHEWHAQDVRRLLETGGDWFDRLEAEALRDLIVDRLKGNRDRDQAKALLAKWEHRLPENIRAALQAAVEAHEAFTAAVEAAKSEGA